jgi:hypothetical protein
MEIDLYGNTAPYAASYKTSSETSNVKKKKKPGKFKVGLRIYEMIDRNVLFNFIPKELLYMKSNSSE